MKRNSTNNYIVASKLLSIRIKVLSIFMLCFLNFYSARNYTSNRNQIHLSSDTEIIEINGSESLEESKIYVTSGTSVLGIGKSNFKIVEISDTKKHIVSKSKATKNSKHKTTKAEPGKQSSTQTMLKTEEGYTSRSESDTAFSVRQNQTNVAAQNQTLSAKHVMTTDDKTIRLSAVILFKAKIAAYFSYYNSSIHQTAASIRPPPATL